MEEDVHFVEVDGRRFYSDRPYLNAMAGAAATPDNADGVQLFSRGRLVASLAGSEGLEACILMTYSVDVPDLKDEFPALFAPRSRVPTLLLHGDKRIRRKYASEPGAPYKLKKEVVQENENVERSRDYVRMPHWEYEAMDPRIHVQNVVPYFSADNEEDGTAKRAPGAFHSKMLLLVTRARLVLVVSTANLTPQMTVDMSWVQAFPRRRLQQQQGGGGKGRDFGKVLDDFLGRIDESLGGQAQQARQACKTKEEGETMAAGTVRNGPRAFLRRHLGGGSGKLDAMFDFSAAAVDLITSAPTFPAKSSSSSSSSRPPPLRVRYGLERMTQLLQRRAGELPSEVHDARKGEDEATKWDRLRIQVTTISPAADQDCKPVLENALQALLPDVDDQWDRHERCELFWPSLSYIKTCRRFPFKYRDDLDEEVRANWDRKNAGGSLFLLPEGLNSLFGHWQSLRQFELHPRVDPGAEHRPTYLRAEGGAYGVDGWTNVPPHVKTFSRSLPETEGEGQRHGEPLATTIPNQQLQPLHRGLGAVGRRRHEELRNRRALPLLGGAGRTRTIPIPLPYRLDGAPYTTQVDEWDTPDLLVVPYFHSLHGLPDLARLRALMPQIEEVFAQVGKDLQELASVHGLDARGRKLLLPHGNVLAAVDANVEKRVLGRQGEEEEGVGGGKRLKATTVPEDGGGKEQSTM